MFENIIVVGVVGTVLFFAGRSFYRTLSGKQEGCSGCGTKSCPASYSCKSFELERIKTQKQTERHS